MNSMHQDFSTLVRNTQIIPSNTYLHSDDELDPWFNSLHNNRNDDKSELPIVSNITDKKELNNLIKIHNDKLKKRKVSFNNIVFSNRSKS